MAATINDILSEIKKNSDEIDSIVQIKVTYVQKNGRFNLVVAGSNSVIPLPVSFTEAQTQSLISVISEGASTVFLVFIQEKKTAIRNLIEQLNLLVQNGALNAGPTGEPK